MKKREDKIRVFEGFVKFSSFNENIDDTANFKVGFLRFNYAVMLYKKHRSIAIFFIL